MHDYRECRGWQKQAHEIHTKLLVEEARDPAALPMTMMLIHASNHLSAAEISREFAERLLRMQAQKDGEEVK